MIEDIPSSAALTGLERRVFEAAIHGHENSTLLRRQLDAAVVAGRTPSGVGFMTKLEVPDQWSMPDHRGVSDLPVVAGDHPDLPSGAEFICQVKAGKLNCLEAYCFEGMWPADERLFRVSLKS